MKKYAFAPDYRNIVCASCNRKAERMPLYEHIIGPKMMKHVLGSDPYAKMGATDPALMREGFSEYWSFWREMGYDTASYECCITEILPGGGALGRHAVPVIQNRADFEAYPWKELPDLYFNAFSEKFRALAETCPPGMKAVGGVGNGVFECVQDVAGYMNLCYLREDDPELYRMLFSRMSEVQETIWKRFLAEFSDVFCVLRFGDDLGFKSSTLLSKSDIIEHIIPAYRRISDLVHEAGKPFLLHSCGNLFGVFDEIIDGAAIDSKHSNEDQIAHFTVWVEKYGNRIGNFGGIDTDVLCRKDPEYIRAYVFDCLEKVKDAGGIAFASGNSIPDYVPAEGYLAMVEAVRDWRGDKCIG